MWCSPTKAAAGEEKKKKSDDAGQEGVYIDDAFPLVYRDPYNSQKRKEEKPKQNRIGSVSKDCCQPSLPFFSLLFFLFFLRHCEIRMGDGRWDYAWQSGSIVERERESPIRPGSPFRFVSHVLQGWRGFSVWGGGCWQIESLWLPFASPFSSSIPRNIRVDKAQPASSHAGLL